MATQSTTINMPSSTEVYAERVRFQTINSPSNSPHAKISSASMLFGFSVYFDFVNGTTITGNIDLYYKKQSESNWTKAGTTHTYTNETYETDRLEFKPHSNHNFLPLDTYEIKYVTSSNSSGYNMQLSKVHFEKYSTRSAFNTFDVEYEQTVNFDITLDGYESNYDEYYCYFDLKDSNGNILLSRKHNGDGEKNFTASISLTKGTYTIGLTTESTLFDRFDGAHATVTYDTDSYAPTLRNVWVNDYRVYTNGVHWVRPNESVRIDYEGIDGKDNMYRGDSYLRALPSSGGDARINGVSNGNAVNNEWMTDSTIDLNGGGAPQVVTRNNTELQSRYFPKPKTHGVTHTLQGYLRDSKDNAYGYFGLGKTIGADGSAPTLEAQGWKTAPRYYDGSVYWMKEGDSCNWNHIGKDLDSGVKRAYLKLKHKGDGDEDVASFHYSDGYNADGREDNNNRINITGASAYRNDTDYLGVTYNIDGNIGDNVYDMQYYFHDRCDNGSGYTDLGVDLGIDGTAPNISFTSHSNGENLGYITDPSVTFTGTASDSSSGVQKIEGNSNDAWETGWFNVDTSSPTSWSYTKSFPDGHSRMHFRAFDNVGNYTSNIYVDLTVDSVAPSVPSGLNVEYEESGYGVVFSWNASSDATSGVDYYQYGYSKDGGSYTAIGTTSSTSKYFSGLSEGTYDFRVRAKDNAGNWCSYTYYNDVAITDNSRPTTPTITTSAVSKPAGSGDGAIEVSGVEATENLFDNSTFDGTSGWSSSHGEIIALGDGVASLRRIDDTSGNFQLSQKTSVSAGEDVTISFDCKKVEGTDIGTNSFSFGVGVWGLEPEWSGSKQITSIGGGWYNITATFPTATNSVSSATTGIHSMASNSTDKYHIKNIQFEKKDHATSFIDGSRLWSNIYANKNNSFALSSSATTIVSNSNMKTDNESYNSGDPLGYYWTSSHDIGRVIARYYDSDDRIYYKGKLQFSYNTTNGTDGEWFDCYANNLAPNYTFELNDVGDTNINGWLNDSGVSEIYESSASGKGRCVKLAGDGNYRRIKSEYSIPVTEGETLYMRAMVNGFSGAKCYIGMKWSDGSYDYFGGIDDCANFHTSGNWQERRGTVTVPTGVTGAQIWFFNYLDNTGDLYLADIYVGREPIQSGGYKAERGYTTYNVQAKGVKGIRVDFNNGGSTSNSGEHLKYLEAYGDWIDYTTNNTYTIDNGINHNEDWYIRADQTDGNGNVSALCSSQSIHTPDNIYPAISYSLTSRAWDNTQVSVNLSYSDSGSGVSTKQYAWSESTATPSTWTDLTSNPVTKSATGEWYLHTRVIDYDNNEVVEYKGKYLIDTMQPEVSFSLQERGWSTSDVSVDITPSDSGGAGINTVEYKWSTSTATPSTWNTWSSNPIIQTNTGQWYLHVRVEDNAGNVLTTYRGLYKIDKTNPTISNNNFSIDSPTGIYDTYTATVSWGCSDGSEVAYTALGLYVDGSWYYKNTNLPSGITCSVGDMSHISGTSNTITFSNIPREVDINVSWEVFDIVGNNTSATDNQIFTPRIINSTSSTHPTSYEVGRSGSGSQPTDFQIGKSSNSVFPTYFNIGRTRKYNHYFTTYTNNVLNKIWTSPTTYNIGQANKTSTYPVKYYVGEKKVDSAPTKYEVIKFKDKLEFFKSDYGQGVRLHQNNIQLPIDLPNDYTIRLKRKPLERFTDEWDEVVVRSDGNTYVNGQLENDFNVSWLGLEPTENMVAGSTMGANADIILGEDSVGKYMIEPSNSTWTTGIYIPYTSINSDTYYNFSIEIMSKKTFTIGVDFNMHADNYSGNDSARADSYYEQKEYNTPNQWQRASWGSKSYADATNPQIKDTFLCPIENEKIYYRNPQLEKNDHATGFTTGTRQDGIIEISNYAWEIDELTVIPKVVSESEIQEWYDKQIYFYSDTNIKSIAKPNSVSMTEL